MDMSILGYFILKMNLQEAKIMLTEIESFWSFTKRRLAKFNGLTDDNFI